MPRSSPCWIILPPVIVVLLSGCDSGAKILRVTGTVRHQGKPVANLTVHFVPAEGKQSSGGTDPEGHYKLSYDRTHEGAVRGNHKIYVTYRPRNAREDLELHEGKVKLPAEMKEILEKYGHVDTTPLTRDVTTEGQVIDLDLD
jgi:hypothetical protein